MKSGGDVLKNTAKIFQNNHGCETTNSIRGRVRRSKLYNIGADS